MTCATAKSGIKSCSTLDLSAACRDTNHDIGLEKENSTNNFINKIPKHCLCYLIICNHTVSHWTHRNKAFWSAAKHFFYFNTDCNNFVVFGGNCNNSWLVCDNSPFSCPY